MLILKCESTFTLTVFSLISSVSFARRATFTCKLSRESNEVKSNKYLLAFHMFSYLNVNFQGIFGNENFMSTMTRDAKKRQRQQNQVKLT
jgi:hypothetical protein